MAAMVFKAPPQFGQYSMCIEALQNLIGFQGAAGFLPFVQGGRSILCPGFPLVQEFPRVVCGYRALSISGEIPGYIVHPVTFLASRARPTRRAAPRPGRATSGRIGSAGGPFKTYR